MRTMGSPECIITTVAIRNVPPQYAPQTLRVPVSRCALPLNPRATSCRRDSAGKRTLHNAVNHTE
jgi:hypothetical protein